MHLAIKNPLKYQVTMNKNTGAGLETRYVDCGVSAHGCSRAVSGLERCKTKANVRQKESEAHSFKVHRLL